MHVAAAAAAILGPAAWAAAQPAQPSAFYRWLAPPVEDQLAADTTPIPPGQGANAVAPVAWGGLRVEVVDEHNRPHTDTNPWSRIYSVGVSLPYSSTTNVVGTPNQTSVAVVDTSDDLHATVDSRNTVSYRLTSDLSLDYKLDILRLPQVRPESQVTQSVRIRYSFGT